MGLQTLAVLHRFTTETCRRSTRNPVILRIISEATARIILRNDLTASEKTQEQITHQVCPPSSCKGRHTRAMATQSRIVLPKIGRQSIRALFQTGERQFNFIACSCITRKLLHIMTSHRTKINDQQRERNTIKTTEQRHLFSAAPVVARHVT